MDSPPAALILIGMPGAGKTTLGKALAKRLGWRFVDADHELVNRTGVPIRTIFEIEGEAGFRAREQTLLAELSHQRGQVLATGGGAILSAQTRQILRDAGIVIYLRASLEDLIARTKRDKKRPLLTGVDQAAVLASMLQIRTPLYEETAHLTVDSSRLSATRLAETTLNALIRDGRLS